MNRRSVLLAFGTASVGLGGAFGSGAFSSVEAARTVTLDTSDDSNAVLGFEPVDSDSNIIATETVGSGSRTVIKIEQASLNAQATTRFEDALRVTNGGNNDVGLSVDPAASDDSGLIGNALDIRDASDTSIVDSTNAVDLDSGTDLTLTVVIDLRGSNSGSDLTKINDIVFAARQADHSSA